MLSGLDFCRVPGVSSEIGRISMDTTYFRENAARCLRLAGSLSLNNPARVQLLELAHDFNRRAQELEGANTRRDETAGRNDRA